MSFQHLEKDTRTYEVILDSLYIYSSVARVATHSPVISALQNTNLLYYAQPVIACAMCWNYSILCYKVTKLG